MKKLIATIISLSFFTTSYSQDDFIKVSGKILNAKTREPLAYANISILKSPIGTVSNDIGEFDIFIPSNFKYDTLSISYVGYRTLKQRISSSTFGETFYLEEVPTILGEVIVSSDGARRLVEEALQSIPSVYPTEPYLLEGFQRSWEKIDFTDSITYPGTLIEAALTIYDPGYGQKKDSPKYEEEVYLNEVRRSALMEGWEYGGNMVKQMLRQNMVRYNRSSILFVKSFLEFPNTLEYEWEGSTVLDSENISIVKIDFPNKREFPVSFKVYISEKDKAILRFDLYGIKTEINYSTLLDWHNEVIDVTYIFKRHSGKPYLSFTKMKYVIKKLDLAKKKVIRTEYYSKELLINNLIIENVENLRKALGQPSKSKSLALQTRPYNSDFWKNYNIVKENPMDKDIISLFEREDKLENQFKSKSRRKDQ